VALLHAVEKLLALGERLPFPHQSAVVGLSRLRELRPRAGRSPWRGLYACSGDRFVILAVCPEAQVDGRGFDRAVGQAGRRLAEVEANSDDRQNNQGGGGAASGA
jgi:hypothetical protein